MPTTIEGSVGIDKIAAAAIQVMHVQDQKTSGTPGGTNTTGTWETRDLNTIVSNTIPGASLLSNVITLPSGTYWLRAITPAYCVTSFKSRVYDSTNSQSLVAGTSEYSYSNTFTSVTSKSEGIVTLSITTDIRLEMHSTTSYSPSGLGKQAGTAEPEVYSEIIIWKLQ